MLQPLLRQPEAQLLLSGALALPCVLSLPRQLLLLRILLNILLPLLCLLPLLGQLLLLLHFLPQPQAELQMSGSLYLVDVLHRPPWHSFLRLLLAKLLPLTSVLPPLLGQFLPMPRPHRQLLMLRRLFLPLVVMPPLWKLLWHPQA